MSKTTFGLQVTNRNINILKSKLYCNIWLNHEHVVYVSTSSMCYLYGSVLYSYQDAYIINMKMATAMSMSIKLRMNKNMIRLNMIRTSDCKNITAISVF